jgi:hypothetical protein
VENGWTLDDAAIEELRKYTDEEKSRQFSTWVTQMLERLGDRLIIEAPGSKATRTSAELRPPADAKPSIIREELFTNLQYISNEERVHEAAVKLADRFPKALRAVIASRIERIMRPANGEALVPVYRYSDELTRAREDAAAADVEQVVNAYVAGTTLIAAKTTLDQENLDLIRAEQAQYLIQVREDPVLRREQLLADLGMAVLVLLVTVGLATYTRLNEPRIVRNPMRALASAALLLAMVAAARVTVLFDWPRESVAAAVVITAAILSMAYTQRFAFGVAGALSILVTLTVIGLGRGGVGLLVMLVTAAGLTAFRLKEVRTRTKLIEIGVVAGVGAFLASAGAGLHSRQTPDFVLGHAGLAAGAALGAAFFVQGMLPLIERGFRISTALNLLEWCDANRPLLRRMSQEAPGTYNHSLVISSMAEAAAEAIGANGLLSRVGALYHDIGKMNKPDYFTENQEARINRHDKLAPTMSLLIIVGHVKDGLAMAKEYGLPSVLHPFIGEHHGTTVVRYFHQMATEQKDKQTTGRHDREVPDSEFRYPGPKPQSKETAILMLCDSVEGAARAMPEPTAGRIESLVHQMAMNRLMDGQLDQCEITLRELRLIEESLVKSLCRFYHTRIAYPQKSEEHLTRNRGSA